jgi:hypothetical protein
VSKSRYNGYHDDEDDNNVSSRSVKPNRLKEKRFQSALKRLDVNALIEDDEDEF